MIENIGGIFLYSKDPKALAKWYEEVLGIKHEYTSEYEAFYASYPYVDPNGKKEFYAIWSIMKNDKRPTSSEKVIGFNLRVSGLEEMLQGFDQKNINYKPMQEHPEGKFAWIDDPDGNCIELWETSGKDL